MTNIDISKAAAALGHKGGSSTSEAKQAASRANGKRGGRPRKDLEMSNKKSITDNRHQLRQRAAEIAANTTGLEAERRYIVRNLLIAEFGITTSYAVRLADEAVKKS